MSLLCDRGICIQSVTHTLRYAEFNIYPQIALRQRPPSASVVDKGSIVFCRNFRRNHWKEFLEVSSDGHVEACLEIFLQGFLEEFLQTSFKATILRLILSTDYIAIFISSLLRMQNNLHKKHYRDHYHHIESQI